MLPDEARNIFGPFNRGDGVETYADPIRVRRKLSALLDGDIRKAIEQTKNPIGPVAMEAMDRLIVAATEALGLVPFNPEDGTGCTEDMVIALLNDYTEFEGQKKTSGETMPTSPASTDAEFSDYRPLRDMASG